jgi:polyisoprenoid-binding protein YceI
MATPFPVVHQTDTKSAPGVALPFGIHQAETTILRSEFDVGRFIPLTSDRVKITINTEMSSK